MIIEADKRLSQSMLWDIQRRYFLDVGIAAWSEDVVPHAISCGTKMAHTYCEMLFAWLQDLAATGTLNRDEPIYIIELGAGSGRLTWHVMQLLLSRLDASPFKDLAIKFVLTDFVPAVIEFWKSHPKMQPFVAEGLLDFAHFDVTDMQPLRLINDGRELISAELKNPIALLANYFFDSIPTDSFVIEDGQLCHNLLTLHSDQAEPDLADPTLWERLELAWEAFPLSAEPYENAAYNHILESYENALPDTRFAFPNIGLDCLNFWRDLSPDGALLLTADRGYTLAESLVGQANPELNLHGSFSLMVNYHAIGHYVEGQGGRAFQTAHYQNNVQISCHILNDIANSYSFLESSFSSVFTLGSPDDAFALREMVGSDFGRFSLPQLLSWLRLSIFDADVFREIHATLLSRIATTSPAWHDDIHTVLDTVEALYLPLRDDDDLKSLVAQIRAEIVKE